MWVIDGEMEILLSHQRRAELQRELAGLRLAGRGSAPGRALSVFHTAKRVAAVFGRPFRRCDHQWSEPGVVRPWGDRQTYGEWACLKCGTRRRSAFIG